MASVGSREKTASVAACWVRSTSLRVRHWSQAVAPTAATAQTHPARLQQRIERPLRGRDAADFLDLGARRRLVVGDDGEDLHRRAGELLRRRRVTRENVGEVGRRAEGPAARDPHEVDAAHRIEPRDLGRDGLDVRAARKTRGEFVVRHRAGRCEDQRLGDAYRLGRQSRRHVSFDRARDLLEALERGVAHEATRWMAGSGRRSISGAKGRSWRTLALPSRTISSVAERAEARIVARSAGSGW